MFKGPFDESIVKRAQKKKLVKIKVHNLRRWGIGKYKQVDDEPYGGGPGMVLKPEPIFRAVENLKKQYDKKNPKGSLTHTILLTPAGRLFNFRIAKKLAELPHLIFICGRYEGVDDRVFEHIADETLSVGDYILSGGEIATMVIVDATVRLIEGVLGKEESKHQESFSFQGGLLRYPQYTRPEEYEGMKVPEILLSGNHRAIAKWRREQALERTKNYRPDLLSET